MSAYRRKYGSRKFLGRRGWAARRAAKGSSYRKGLYGQMGGYKRRTPRVRTKYSGFNNFRSGGYVGKELKFYDTSIPFRLIGAPTNAAGGEVDPTSLNTLSAPEQGDGPSERIGRRLTSKSIFVNGVVKWEGQNNSTNQNNPPVVFIALVLDTQSNAVQLNSEDVFTNPSGDTTLASSPMRNLQFIDRFKVLQMTQVRTPQPSMAFAGVVTEFVTNSLLFPFKFFQSLKDMPVTFKANLAGIANVTDNSLHIIAYASSSGDTSQEVLMSYNSRFRYTG